MTTTITLSANEYQALLAEQQRLASQLRLVTVERDLLKERVDAFLHRLYAAKSEARANPTQRDLFLNEAEALAPNGTPVAEESTPEAVEVAGHSRKKRGRIGAGRGASSAGGVVSCKVRPASGICWAREGKARPMAKVSVPRRNEADDFTENVLHEVF